MSDFGPPDHDWDKQRRHGKQDSSKSAKCLLDALNLPPTGHLEDEDAGDGILAGLEEDNTG